MEKPHKQSPEKALRQGWSYAEQVGYNQACDDWQAYHDQEMARKVWLDETTINQELLSRTSWFSDYQEGKVSQGWLRHKLAQTICSMSGELIKGE